VSPDRHDTKRFASLFSHHKEEFIRQKSLRRGQPGAVHPTLLDGVRQAGERAA
jgi:hypothetical protein